MEMHDDSHESAENIKNSNQEESNFKTLQRLCYTSKDNDEYNFSCSLGLEQIEKSLNTTLSHEKSYTDLTSTSLCGNSSFVNDKTINLYHPHNKTDFQSTSRLQNRNDTFISSAFEAIMHKLEDMSKEMHFIQEQVNKLVNSQSLMNDTHSIIQNLNLPISTREDYQEFNSNGTKLKTLQAYLITLDGLDLRGALNAFLKVTMTDKFLAENITWKKGKKKDGQNKLSFRESAISQTFFGDARRLVRLGEISFKEYYSEIKCAIKNATQRVYMSKTVRSKQKNVDQVEKESHLMQMYEAA